MKFLPAWITVAALTWATPLLAHPAPFSYVDVRLEPGAVDLTLVIHVLDAAHELQVPEARLLEPDGLALHREALTALIDRRLEVLADGGRLSGGVWSPPDFVPDRHGLRLHVRYATNGLPARLVLSAWLFPYDPVHQTFVNVYEGTALMAQAILTEDRRAFEYFSGTRQGTWAVVRKFAASGVHHILIGPDHLLFLFGLLLPGGSVRALILMVSAFTVAHSLTLSLAALNILTPPASMVEPAIALSIVYVGADNLTVRGGRDLRVWIALAFGLIHGFGFASVLREMDLPARALGLSLLSFNLGVEIGQVLVVLTVALLLRAIRARSEVAGRRLTLAGSVFIIVAGTFWFVERVFFSSAA